MESKYIIQAKSFTTVEAYHKEVKSMVFSMLRDRVALFGLTAEDLEDLQTVRKYKIGRNDNTYSQHKTEMYYAMGISLVQAIWTTTSCTLSIPYSVPDYTQSKEWLASYQPRT